MKKMQTLALALALIALGSVSWAATSLNSSGSMQKKPPETDATNLNSSRSNIYRVKVTKVNEKDKTFAVEVTFSAKAIPLPKKEEKVDVIYAPNPTGGPPEATTIKGSKSNSSERVLSQQGRVDDTDSPRVITGKVTQVNEKDKTFTVEVTLSAKTLLTLPEVGKIYDITFTQTTPGGPLEAVKLNSSKSNIY